MMDFTADLKNIQHLLNQEQFTAVAKDCTGLIEHILKHVLNEYEPKLEDGDRLKIQEARQSSHSKGQKVTFGNLWHILDEGDFFTAWQRIAGIEPTNIQLIDFGRLVSLRNDLIHNNRKADASLAQKLFTNLNDILQDVEKMSRTAALTFLNEQSTDSVPDQPLIAVSYARADNPLIAPEIADPHLSASEVRRWATKWAEFLGSRLYLHVGHAWENMSVTPEWLDRLQTIPVLIVMLSRNYCVSEWCDRKNGLLQAIQERIVTGLPVCIVERDWYAANHRPPELGRCEGIRFWVPDPAGDKASLSLQPVDAHYQAQLTSLMRKIGDVLPKEDHAIIPVHTDQRQHTVFLAKVTDDLYFDREDVKRHLIREHIKVLPDQHYPGELDPFQEAVRHDIAHSDVFVQLLSAASGNTPFDRPPEASRRQFELVWQMARKPKIIQWRPGNLDLETVADNEYRKMLRAARSDLSLPALKNEIVRKCQELTTTSSETVDKLIFFNPGLHPFPLDTVYKVLHQEGVEYADSARFQGITFYQEIEKGLLQCPGLIMTYGQSDDRWLMQMLSSIQRTGPKRKDHPLSAYIVYEPSIEQFPPFPIRTFRGVQKIEYGSSADEPKLHTFIQDLKQQVHYGEHV